MAELVPRAFIEEDPGGTYPSGPAPTAVIPGSNVGEVTGLQQRTLVRPGIPQWQTNVSQLMMILSAGLGDLASPEGRKADAMTPVIMAVQAAQAAQALQKLQSDALKGLATIAAASRRNPEGALAAYDQFIQTAPQELDPKILQHAITSRQKLEVSTALVKTTAGLPTGEAKADFIKSAAAAAGPDFGSFLGHIVGMANTIEAAKPPQAHISGGQLVVWDPKDPRGTVKAVPIAGLVAKDTRTIEEKKMEAYAGVYAGESWMGLVNKAIAGDPKARATLGRVMAEVEKDPKLSSERDVMAVAMYGPAGTKEKNANVADLGSLARVNPRAAQDVLEATLLMQEKAKGSVAYTVAIAQMQAKDMEEPDPSKYRFFDRAKLIQGYATELKYGTIGAAKDAERKKQAIRVSADEAKAIKGIENLGAVVDLMERTGRSLSPKAGWGVIVQSLSQPVLQTLGVAGVATELGVMQAYNLRLAKILQSAGGSGGGQVSDADARAAAMANINPNDSVGSAMIKVGILRKLNHINMLLEAGLSPRDLGVTAFTRESADHLERQLGATTRAPVPSDWKPVRR